MAGKVFFSVSMSLDGFIAPGSLGELMGQQWMELQQWIFPQRFFRENLKLGEGGEEGRDNDIARETFERTGASVMGKRMFDAGEQMWPEEAPFHTPVFVVTHHEKRDPGSGRGGTTFHFPSTTASSPRSTRPARSPAHRDVRILGGGATILEVQERRPDRRTSSRSRSHPCCSWLRNPPVRLAWTRAAWPQNRSAGADAAGDPPDLHTVRER